MTERTNMNIPPPESSERRKRSIDFSIKAAWLSIAKMYNSLGQDFDITHSTGFVLLNIDEEEGTPATKIAPLMGMEARSLTRLLKTMEENGYIERMADKQDGRKVIIRLTTEGKRKREMSKQTVKTFLGRVQQKLSDEELRIFFHVMDKVQQTIQTPKQEMVEEIRERLLQKGIE